MFESLSMSKLLFLDLMFFLRLLTTGSVEEKIFQRQLSKAGLNEAVVDQTHTSAVRLSDEELKVFFFFFKIIIINLLHIQYEVCSEIKEC